MKENDQSKLELDKEDRTEANDDEVEQKKKRPNPIVVLLSEDGGQVIDPDMNDELYEKSYFGRLNTENQILFLFPEELMIFSERKRLVAITGQSMEEARKLLQEIYNIWEEHGYMGIKADGRFLTNEQLYKHVSSHNPNFWEKYVVYRDLKTRGYIVRRGIEEISHFRVYKKGAKKGEQAVKYVFFGVFEGKPISLLKLFEISEHAMKNRQDLILATVDRLSDITYYSLKKQNL
ncbi:MAG: tRNA-intron lyase [Promethearchaeota archaeon]